MFTYTFFVVFHHKICVFIVFISFFDKVSNFLNRILTNQKCELVASNCQRNCMNSKKNMLPIFDQAAINYLSGSRHFQGRIRNFQGGKMKFQQLPTSGYKNGYIFSRNPSICNFVSMKIHVELNSPSSKLFCFIIWFVMLPDQTRHL